MIAFVNGQVSQVNEDSLVLDIGGVGLNVCVPMNRLQPRPVVGDTLLLHTYLQVREDAWTLYGFGNQEQLFLFRQLLSVTGVGAKIALAIVDGVNPQRFATAIANKDIKVLTAVSGVGKKIAERILLELKDKFAQFTFDEQQESFVPAETEEEALDKDLVAALKQLGYTATESRAFALSAQAALGAEATTEQLLRQALKIARTV